MHAYINLQSGQVRMQGTHIEQNVWKPSTSHINDKTCARYQTIQHNKTARMGDLNHNLNFGHRVHQQNSMPQHNTLLQEDIMHQKCKAMNPINTSRYVNIQLDESLLASELPHNINMCKKKKIGYKSAGKTHSLANDLKMQDVEKWRDREPFVMMKKGRLFTKIKCPCISKSNPIKSYMKIQRVNLMSPPYNFKLLSPKNPGIDHKDFMVSNSFNPEPHEHEHEHTHRSPQRKQLIVRRRFSSLKANKQKMSPCLRTHKKLLQEFLVRKPVLRRDYFVFGMSQRNIQENKTQNFRDFLWRINYSNGLYVYTPQQTEKQYRFYVGYGNNYHLIRAMMKKRFWWVQTDRAESAHFVWTQLKQEKIYEMQKNGTVQDEPEMKECCIDTGTDTAMKKLCNSYDLQNWQIFCNQHKKTEQKITEKTYVKRLSLFKNKKINKITNSSSVLMHNHLQYNYYVGNKKALFYYMRQHLKAKNVDPFSILPMTFHITQGVKDPEFKAFEQYFNDIEQKKEESKLKNVWIVKPGEYTNRGNGITVCYKLDDILIRLKGQERNKDGKLRTFIVQKYIERPLLYCKRKFDIRHFMLVTCINGQFKGYWFEEGYLRTASNQFNLRCSKDPYVHLTNDAVQKNCETYGRYEKGNKLSYAEFQKYIDGLGKTNRTDFVEQVLPKMKEMGAEAIRATFPMLAQSRKEHNFQLLGLDFMIDEDFKPWLIEINTNPCLETSSCILEKMIPQLIDSTLKLCVDPLFPPPENWQPNKKIYFGENPMQENKYTLVFDSVSEGKKAQQLVMGAEDLTQQMGKIEEDAELFEDDGDENWETTN